MPLPCFKASEVHLWDEPLINIYTHDCGLVPIRSRSGNQYIMIAFCCDSNTIIYAAYKMRSNKHRITAYISIMKRLTIRGHKVNLQVVDKESSAAYKKVVEGTWKAKYQLIPPDVHRCNAAEHAICTFKALLLAILAGVDPTFPRNIWYKLLPQTELTLNLMRQSTLNPRIFSW